MARPSLSLRIIPRFPAKILPGDGIGIIRTGGTVTIRMDWSDIQQSGLPVDPSTYEFTLRAADGSLIRVPVQSIILPVVTWGTLSGKPSEFPPAPHTHGIPDIANLATELSARLTILGVGTAGQVPTSNGTGNAVTWETPPSQTVALGQCYLSKITTNLVLSPLNGNLLTINGVYRTIPSGGVSLAATGLTPSTLYYIYAYMAGSTMTLEASTTAPATDSSTGVRIKTGDATRTLVGMARPITGPAWQDTEAQRFVLSHFNRRGRSLFSKLTSNVTTTSTTYVEMSTTLRVEFLTWGDRNLSAQAGSWSTNSTTGVNFLCTAIDGSVPSTGARHTAAASTSAAPTMASFVGQISEGYHYLTLFGRVSAGMMTLGGVAIDDGNANYVVGEVVG